MDQFNSDWARAIAASLQQSDTSSAAASAPQYITTAPGPAVAQVECPIHHKQTTVPSHMHKLRLCYGSLQTLNASVMESIMCRSAQDFLVDCFTHILKPK